MHFTAAVCRYLAHIVLRNVHLVIANLVRLVRRNEIGKVHFSVFDDLLRVHLSMEIAQVVHLLGELLHACARQFLIIDNRRLAHLVCVARKAFLGLGCCVRRSGVIDMKLQFPETENLRVLFLPQVTAQVRNGLVIYTLDLRLIEQILVLRHELGGVTCRKSQQQKRP